MAKTHEFPEDRVHFTWAKDPEPVLTIQSEDTVLFKTQEVADNQFNKNSTSEDIAGLDLGRVYLLAGPVEVEGAEPGDALEVEIVDSKPGGWGWTAILPALGLLPEDFPNAYLKTFDLSNGEFIHFNERIKIPITPFLGTMGVSPKEAHGQAIMPPGIFGGNLDPRQLTVSTKLYLPVQVSGALFSCGDAHAAQGDGEVCVSAFECPMTATLKFRLIKGKRISAPQFLTKGALTPKVNHKGFYKTTGVVPGLMKCAQDAVRAMVNHLSESYGMEAKDAYLLSKLCVDLKISEIIDAEQYVVSAVLPLAVFDEETK
ncbi:acetamidase/formamidase family protein [Planococcus shenhongbingii]|uniref:acetamidase/formamidase family protein n=1 Tax=Planococcus shenhongbingii TaxID=3058398 RepID=UPI00261C7B32|nr:acetamidase/formamidase family protein [Planococcus sp. N016]WKA57731.1 acetamidase/formamidase family protein [Planococcus sp. N016]